MAFPDHDNVICIGICFLNNNLISFADGRGGFGPGRPSGYGNYYLLYPGIHIYYTKYYDWGLGIFNGRPGKN